MSQTRNLQLLRVEQYQSTFRGIFFFENKKRREANLKLSWHRDATYSNFSLNDGSLLIHELNL